MTTPFTLRESRAWPSSGEVCLEVYLRCPSLCLHLFFNTNVLQNFEAVVWLGYYVPMQESHPTVQAITHRVEFTERGTWNYVEGPKPDMDRNTFVVAHFLVVRAIEALGLHLKIDLEPMLEDLWKAYMGILK